MSRASQTFGALAAVAMVLAAAGATLTFTASGASAARVHKTSPQAPARPATLAGEQFRGDVQTWVNGLRGVVKQMRANPAIAKSLSSTGTNLLPNLAAAKQEVARLDWAELGELQAGLNKHYPNWQRAPKALSVAVPAFNAATATPPGSSAPTKPGAGGPLAATSGSGTFTDDCAMAGDPYAEVIFALELNEIQNGLYATAIALPGVFELAPLLGSPNPAKIVVAILWGVANGSYLALAQTLTIAVDCAASAFGATQTGTLPHDPAGAANPVVPGSTQFSIDRLIAKAGDTQTKMNAVLTTVNTVKTQTDTVDTAVTDLNDILDDITDRVDDVQTSLQTLQTNVAVLNNTEVTILKKADTLIANLSAFETLQLRMAIEQNLDKNNGEAAIGLFQLPAVFGGYLEVVKSIVTETLAKTAAVAGPNSKAMAYLTQANAAFTAGTYKTAYGLYRKAYTYGR